MSNGTKATLAALAALAAAGAVVKRRGSRSSEDALLRSISEIESKTGLAVRYEAEPHYLIIELFRDGEKVGYFRASTVNPEGFMWKGTYGHGSPDDCKQAWRQMGQPPMWVVRGAEWFDPSLRGRGWGKLLYEALFDYAGRRGGVIGPDRCAGEHTSQDAERVWRSLRARYPSYGPWLDVRKGSMSKIDSRLYY